MTVVDTFIAPVCDEQIKILYQDDAIVLIDKPSGLLSLSGKNPLNKDSIHFRLVQLFPSIAMVHRLDFGTSGIMVLALSKSVNAHLTKQFQNREIVKTYIAIVDGHLPQDSGCIDVAIKKDKLKFPLQTICSETGKRAISDYKVIERLDAPVTTRVQFMPVTGRTHQLRVHSQAIGHSILGCDLYGTPKTQSMANRLMLHADSLAFSHPISGEKIIGRSVCPF